MSARPLPIAQTVPDDLQARLDAWGRCADHRLDPVRAALDLAAVTASPVRIEAARRHLDELTASARQMIEAEGVIGLERHVQLLGQLLFIDFGYGRHRPPVAGPKLVRNHHDEAPPNPGVGLLNTMETRRGSGVTLGLLFQHLARSTGLCADVLAVPGDFLVRVEAANRNGARLIIDPADKAATVTPPQLRQRLKITHGARVELRPAHWAGLDKRSILLRLQNECRLDLLRQGRLADALVVVHATQRVAPNHPRLWRDEALINVRLGRTEAAISAYETYIGRARDGQTRTESSLLLDHLRRHCD